VRLFCLARAVSPYATAQAACLQSHPAVRHRLRSPGRRAHRQTLAATAPRCRQGAAGADQRRCVRRSTAPRDRAARRKARTRPEAQGGAAGRPEAPVRARHQRADARPALPVPLRGARHLPADDHAGGTRRSQARHERSGAQRPAGEPGARRAGVGQRPRSKGRHRAVQDRQARGVGETVLPGDAARGQAPRRLAAGQGRQPDPGCREGAARAAPGAQRGAGVQGHQHARQGARARAAGRGLPERQDARRRRPALHRLAAAAGRLLGAPWQDHGELEPGRPYLLPHRGAAGTCTDDQPVRLPRVAGCGAAVRSRHRDHRQDRGTEDAQGLHPRQERGVGRDGAQPRAELRAQPVDGSRGRLHHPHRHRRHRQDADDSGLGPEPGARRPALQRNHRHPRHRAAGRGHRFPARHRGGKDGAVDGRARRQPRGAGARRWQRRRMGPRGDAGSGAQQDPHQEPQLHAWAHVPQQVRPHRRGAEPDAQADEDADHARRPRHQDRLPGQPGADRHAVSQRRQFGPNLRGRPLQGLAALGPRDAGARRALAAGRLRVRRAVSARAAASAPATRPPGP